MYGMMPRPKIVLWLRLPPLNIDTKPRTLPSAPPPPTLWCIFS